MKDAFSVLGKFITAYRASRRFRKREREWDDSPRKKELDAERDLPPRPLTPEEEDLIRWMLEHSSEEARLFLPQLKGIGAVRSCICGCPSISLVVSGDVAAQIPYADHVISDWLGHTTKDELVGAMLFQVGGKLDALEVYSLGGEIKSETQEFGLPAISTLEPFSPSNPAANE